MKPKKVAIVAEWMTSRGGAEKVVLSLLEIFPQADIFTTVYNKELFPELKSKKIKTSFLQYLPYLNKKHQYLFPLMPWAVGSLDLKGYDLIISSSSAFGKGIRKPQGAIHVCYCHTPMRYVWQPEIDDRLIKQPFGNWIITELKRWDLKSNKNVNFFVSNSSYTRQRIKDSYDRDAEVIYPPACPVRDIQSNGVDSSKKRKDFYFAISRLIPYKKIDLAIKACNELQRKLIVAGIGPEFENLKKLAGPTVLIAGRIDESEKSRLFQEAKALIFPAEEDFGIVPVEAMSSGCPVVAFKHGGTSETIIDGKTGVLFEEQSVDSLKRAILKAEKTEVKSIELKEQAKKFSKVEFIKKFKKFVERI